MDDDLSLMVRAAWLYHVGGLNQAETAERMGLTRARVNRLLAEAREAGHVTITIDDRLAGTLPQEDILAQAFGLEFCHVTPPLGFSGAPGEMHRRLAFRAVGLAAANVLRRELARRRDLTVAVGWGRTLDSMTRHLTGVEAPEARFISLMGSLTANATANPFEVIFDLTRRTGAIGMVLPVPFIVDTPAEREILLSQRVVASAVDIARAADLALVSLGDLSEETLLRRQGMISSADLRRLRASGAVADTTGRFYRADGSPVDDELNARILAVPLEELSARTVLLVAGVEKAAAAAAVLRSGEIRGAIIDGDTAERISRNLRALAA
jgi:DNA-binding transcriptional regulator LsrR (DeoR family)